MQISIYPRGFAAGSLNVLTQTGKGMVEVAKVDGDKAVAKIFTNAVRSHIHNLTSEDKLELVELARDLFGDFDTFVRYNLSSNRLVHGAAHDFLADTANFVAMGVRSVSVNLWATLVEDNPKAVLLQEKPNYTDTPNIGSNYIVRWLSQPNGIDDLLYSMFIIFGGDVKEDAPVSRTGLFVI